MEVRADVAIVVHCRTVLHARECGVLDTLKRHWPEYLMEAAGLACFVVVASIVTTLLEYSGSPIHQVIESQFLRNIVLGITLGGLVAAMVYSPWGKQSGAHINPAVTWAFFRLRQIKLWDAVFYSLAQLGGAIGAVQVMRILIGRPYAHADVDFVATRPGPAGPVVAFLAEFVISFVLMLVVLVAVNSKRLQKLTGLFVGLLIATYLAFETPLSGMSLNPARTLGSTLAAGHWTSLWIYLVAPTAAMLFAAEVYLRLRPGRQLACAKLHHRNDKRCIFCESPRGPAYPAEAGVYRLD